jgi:hypothetical protein
MAFAPRPLFSLEEFSQMLKGPCVVPGVRKTGRGKRPGEQDGKPDRCSFDSILMTKGSKIPDGGARQGVVYQNLA